MLFLLSPVKLRGVRLAGPRPLRSLHQASRKALDLREAQRPPADARAALARLPVWPACRSGPLAGLARFPVGP